MTVPVGNEVVVIARAGLMVKVKLAVAVSFGLVESVTVSVTVEVPVPETVGIPVIWPVALRERPAGSPVAVNVYGVVPPVAVTAALYAAFTAPFGRVVVEITTPEITLTLRVALTTPGVLELAVITVD